MSGVSADLPRLPCSFLTDEECAALIARGAEKGFVRSEDAGAMREDGTMAPITSHHRTSFTAWCDNKECLADPLIQRVMARAEKLTLLNSNHSEFIQVSVQLHVLRRLPQALDVLQLPRRSFSTIPGSTTGVITILFTLVNAFEPVRVLLSSERWHLMCSRANFCCHAALASTRSSCTCPM